MDFHAKSIAQAFAELQTSHHGIAERSVAGVRKKHGANTLPRATNHLSAVRLLASQFRSPLILLLIIAGAVSAAVREWAEAGIIFFTACVNVVIGFGQEFKANQSMERLRSLVTYRAVVVRSDTRKQIASEDIVVGDILVLEAGDKVQADGRIISCRDFEVNEAALTGESQAAKKNNDVLQLSVALADRANMVYHGTVVVRGQATVVVTAVGPKTEIGRIATLVEETVEEETPLQHQLARIGRGIGVVVFLIAALLIVFGLLVRADEYTALELFVTAIAVAVAAVPEGLAISLTVILAIGMQYILKKNALTRKLVAVETLGSVSVVCTDKTGTLTHGQMEVECIETLSQKWTRGEREMDVPLDRLLRMAVLCNDGAVENPQSTEKEWRCTGDTTDTAIVRAGLRLNLQKSYLETAMPRLDSIPFSSETKLMATLHQTESAPLLYVKGAFEKIIERVTHVHVADRDQALSQHKKTLEAQHERLAQQGLRVLAVAYKTMAAHTRSIELSQVEELTFVGFIALFDPVRDDVKETLAAAGRAGIRVIMVTGDHVATARTVALALGFDTTRCVEGREIDAWSDEELHEVAQSASVFARVDPKHKIRLVQVLQKHGDVVAMTGDGVNDAPAIKAADIGVALGSGTDVAKETADMILLNDSFTTIIDAVAEGRRIYQNIKKVLLYLFAGSFTEVLLISAGLLLGLPLPLLPAQILWLNIIEESLPVMALAFEPSERENMRERPRGRSAPVFDRRMITLLLFIMVVTNALLFFLFTKYLSSNGLDFARTLVFAGVGVSVLTYIFPLRSVRHPVWRVSFVQNTLLLCAVGIGVSLLLFAVYAPFAQQFLQTVPLPLWAWGVLLLFALCTMLCIECIKWFFSHFPRYVHYR